MRLSLAFAYPAEILAHLSAEERASVWAVVDAVSVNILAPKAAELVVDIRKTRPNLPVRTHSYTGWLYALPGQRGIQPPRPALQGSAGTTMRDAFDRGRKDAIAAVTLRAVEHEANHEAGMARAEVRARNDAGIPTKWFCRPDVAKLRDRWLDGFQQRLADASAHVSLVDLSFLDLAEFYPDPPPLSARWNAAPVAKAIMAYGTDDDAGEARNLIYYEKKLAKAERLSPLPLRLYVGVGRVAGPGNVVGSDEALRALVQAPPDRLEEVVGYVGSGAWRQLVQGNPEFPPIAKLWPELRTLSAGAALTAPKGACA